MAVYFLDTSAVVKRYIQEPGTAWMKAVCDPSAGHFLYLARITEVEFTSAIARRRNQPGLSANEARAALHEFQLDLAQGYRIQEITTALIHRAAQLADAHTLRAYDAVQLSAAGLLRQQIAPLTLVSADLELNAAAAVEGFAVEDPNAHP